jgi:ketosteroid isomerase-like protein
MFRHRKSLFHALAVILLSNSAASLTFAQAAGAKSEIEAFNKKFIDAHLRMDHAAIFAMWADDGVSLLPETPPLIGKPAITKFVEDIVAQMPGYKVITQEIDFQNIQIAGDWAYEWGLEHQVVQPPDGKPPLDGRGKILLILHKDSSGAWKIQQEMWNSLPKPKA